MNSGWADETKYVLSRLDDIQKELGDARGEFKAGLTEVKGELKGLKGKVAVVASFVSVTIGGVFTGLLKKFGII